MKTIRKHIVGLFLMAVVMCGFLSAGLAAYATEGEEHAHSEQCYAVAGDLLCTLSESEGHVHDEACFDADGKLTCDLEETEGHAHDKDCYALGGELICNKDEASVPALLSDDDPAIDDFDSLEKAIDDAADGKQTEVLISGDVEFTETLVIPKGKDIVLKTDKDEAISCTTSALVSKPMIEVTEGARLKLDGNITLDGSSAQSFVLCKGTLVLENGTLSNCTKKGNDWRIGAVTAAGASASFTMNGGAIENTSSHSAYTGAVYIKDGATATMNGGAITGSSFTNQFCAAVIVDSAKFVMNDGEISGNSCAEADLHCAGGVLVVAIEDHATAQTAKTSAFEMNGGTIAGNESVRGGGVYVIGGSVNYTDFYSRAQFTMNGGTISKNVTRNSKGTVSAGGGVYVEWGGNVTMNDGSISGNSTQGMGGGVATADAFTNYYGKNSYESAGDAHYNDIYYRDWDSVFPAGFAMNGGSITQNKALSVSQSGDEGCGGGIYVSSNNVVLNAGDISGNESGKQGGGVYVGSVPYVLTMKAALITGNSASVIGGGVWLCPTGEIDASVNNGSGIFGNSASGAADDFAAVHTYNNTSVTTIAQHMLGGGLANWYQDGAIDTSSQLGSASADVARYDAESSDNTPVTAIEELKGSLSLKAAPTAASQKLAKSLATLTITNNKSARGGGIGSNGDVEIGESFGLTRDLAINKKWVGSNDTPDSIKVWVVVDGNRTECVELTKDNGWTAMVTGLPIGGALTVEEEGIEGWSPAYEYETAESGNVSATVTNTWETHKEEPGIDEPNDEPEADEPSDKSETDEDEGEDAAEDEVSPAAEAQASESSSDAAKTGDDGALAPLMFLVVIFATGAIAVAAARKRGKATRSNR